MMVLASNESAPATCVTHSQTGSSKVLIEGMGVSRVTEDSAGGTINGPGNAKVTVEGSVISVVGDTIAGHGLGLHAGATTTATQTKLNIGE